jgi:hypothetical protein
VDGESGSESGRAQDRVRVSDQEREAVVARLNAATAEGRLTLEEFGERAGEAYAARTVADLAKLVDDLPSAAVAVAGASAPVVPAARRTPSAEVVPVGTIKRTGRWRLEQDTRFDIVVGTAKLDLRQAEVAGAEVALHVSTVVGSVKVWVPHGVRVEVAGRTIVGTRKVFEGEPTGHGGPLLRLVLDTVVGSVKIYRT